MADAAHKRVEELFQQAVDLPVEQREAFLEQACGSDGELKSELAALLAQSDDDASSFLEHPVFVPKKGEPAPTALPPDSFAGYEIVGQIHRGGQGVVYQAIQKSTQRTVAIKVMREGPFAGPVDKARFEREVHILGQLNHPHIVAIHDSGEADGHFYFVMDYVSGQSLDAYMADGPRAIDETLKLFGRMCEAVNAAHLRGVIHRDLKPGNIRIDENGEPHILDFGLAKVATSEAEASAMTLTGQFVGSPPWASPEQAEGAPSKIDMRTDVYSLGVVLYQMLTGKFPYEVMGNTRDVLDRIMKAEPARPSTVRRQINDEVETIVLKCLSKERERRYQTAGELVRDVNHYLSGEPIEAKRDSAWYVFRKSVRRYKLPIAIAASFVLLISSSTVALSIMYANQSRARQAEVEQRQLAEANQAKAEQEAQRARTEAAKSQRATRFIQRMLSGVDPTVAGGLDKTLMRVILDKAAAEIETELVDQPEVEASIRETIGSTYRAIGEYPLAQAHLEQALKIRQRVLREEHPDTLVSMSNLAVLYLQQGRHDQAEPLLVRVLETRKRVLGEEHPNTLKTMVNLAPLYHAQGRYAEAEPLLVRALEINRRVLGEEHPNTLGSMNNLASLYHAQGRYAEAEPLLARVLEIVERALGEEHPNTLISMNNLASLYQRQGRHDQAEPLFVHALEICQRVLGEEHPNTLVFMNNLGDLYTAAARLDEAEALLAAAIDGGRRSLREGHPTIGDFLADYGACLTRLERYDEAETALLEAHQTLTAALGPAHKTTIKSVRHLMALYEAWDKPELAAEWQAKLDATPPTSSAEAER